jgi:GNAT superfamily N-acetyltransferase
MASLRASDGLKEDLTPWLGSLYVWKKVRGQGRGKRLIRQIEGKAIELGFGKLRLLAYDQSLSVWYSSLGWHRAGTDSAHGHAVTVTKTSLI